MRDATGGQLRFARQTSLCHRLAPLRYNPPAQMHLVRDVTGEQFSETLESALRPHME